MVRPGVTVMVGIPSFGMVSTYFMQTVAAMQYPLVTSKVENVVLNKKIDDARNEIVEEALRQGAQYIFWLDDDVVTPGDSFLKLYRHQKDIVNGVYWSKSNPSMPLLFRGHLEGPYWDWHVGDFIEIDAAGNGLTLVKTDVYRKIQKELGEPWYSVDYASFPGLTKGGANNTEDLYFYWKARQAGYKIYADTSVQGMHYDSTNKVFYYGPAYAPQMNPAWEIKPAGSKLIADIGSGPQSPYMMDEGKVVSFDIREEVKPDVVCDVRYLPCADETFDIVYSSHVLEHFPWTGADKVLKEWVRVLKVGGELRLVVPNLKSVGQRLADDNIWPTDLQVLYGEQEYVKNFHAGGFTPKTLTSLVESIKTATGEPVFEDIQVKESADFNGPPPESWNLQLKAKKVRDSSTQENISPADALSVPPKSQLWPMRVFDAPKDRTAEELLAQTEWLFPPTLESRAATVIANAKNFDLLRRNDPTILDETEPVAETV